MGGEIIINNVMKLDSAVHSDDYLNTVQANRVAYSFQEAFKKLS